MSLRMYLALAAELCKREHPRVLPARAAVSHPRARPHRAPHHRGAPHLPEPREAHAVVQGGRAAHQVAPRHPRGSVCASAVFFDFAVCSRARAQGWTGSGRCSTSGARTRRRTRLTRCARVSTAGARCCLGISTRRCVRGARLSAAPADAPRQVQDLSGENMRKYWTMEEFDRLMLTF